MKEYATRALKQIESSSKKGIWGAHWGCAVIAGALLIDEKLIEGDAKASVTGLLESILKSQADFQEEGSEDRIFLRRELFERKLLAELAIKAEEPKELGHDVIYSAYTLRALDHFKITPWESLLDGVTMLVRKVKAAGPGWMTINGKKKFTKPDKADEKTEADYWTIFSNFDRSPLMEMGDMQLGHVLTHGHAIEMIRPWAGGALTADFDLAYRKRLHALHLANEEEKEKSVLPRRKLDPRKKEYWTLAESRGGMQDHVLKYAYSFLDLRRDRVSAADLEAYGRIL